MGLRFQKTGAFTLIEAIVGMVVVTIIGFAAWMAVNVLSPATHATQYRIKAEHLITLSEEELHQYANVVQYVNGVYVYNFDNLPNCNFIQPNNPCGFADVSAQFPGFTRTLNYILADSTPTDLMKFDIHVTWQELGHTQQKDSVILLVKPSAPLPGNIYGQVYDATTGQILADARITAQDLSSANTTDSTSSHSNTLPAPPGANKSPNYNFANPNFILPAGTWQVTATRQGYSPFTYPQNFVINGPDQFEADMPMTHNGTILVNFNNVGPTASAPAFPNGNIIQLDEGGMAPSLSVVSSVSAVNTAAAFDVNFPPNTNQLCFTVFTMNAYQSGWSGDYFCNGFPYQYNGWSSAQATQADAVLNCSANQQGGPDNICVTPGQTTTVNIPLVPVPTATVILNVVDSTGNPVPATAANPLWILVHWYNNTLYSKIPETTPGPYNIPVPAEQDLFPPNNNVVITANWYIQTPQCCNQNGNVPASLQATVPGPLHQGNTVGPLTLQFAAAGSAPTCGDVTGGVIDASTGASLAGASVSVSTASSATNGAGQYYLQCNGTPPYDVPAGNNDIISATATNYYPFTSTGNQYYMPTSGINVPGNQTVSAGTLGLWPIGYTAVSGTVGEDVDGVFNGMGGINVILHRWNGGTLSAVTNSNGQFLFPRVQETWPPASVLGNPAYNQVALGGDYITIAATGAYGAYQSPSTFTLTAGVPYTVQIVLASIGGA